MPMPELERTARLGIAATSPKISPRSHVFNTVASFAFNARFPRLAYRTRWITRAGPRGIALSVLGGFAGRLALDAFFRWSARESLRQRAIRERLRAELGRPPWPEEFLLAWEEERGAGRLR
jgi:hypothetical protein